MSDEHDDLYATRPLRGIKSDPVEYIPRGEPVNTDPAPSDATGEAWGKVRASLVAADSFISAVRHHHIGDLHSSEVALEMDELVRVLREASPTLTRLRERMGEVEADRDRLQQDYDLLIDDYKQAQLQGTRLQQRVTALEQMIEEVAGMPGKDWLEGQLKLAAMLDAARQAKEGEIC